MARHGDDTPQTTDRVRPQAHRGRGAGGNPSGRYEPLVRLACGDGWRDPDPPAPLKTTVLPDSSRSVIARNQSPDIGFERSINPYRGCEHGCVYCFARPSHAWLGLSPGLDFETRLFFKSNAAKLLRRELARPRYQCKTVALGTSTDPYQPIERARRITRSILEVLAECRHPVTVVTKSALIVRDIDLLADLARDGLVKACLSVTTLDRRLARAMEPRAATPARRIDAIAALAAAGIPTGIMVAPVIPGLTDHEIEAILAAAAGAGAREAGYILLRLPLEVADLFREWLAEALPGRAGRVMNLVRETHGGRTYDPAWHRRMTGAGAYAGMIAKRFHLARERLDLAGTDRQLDTARFRPPRPESRQLRLL